MENNELDKQYCDDDNDDDDDGRNDSYQLLSISSRRGSHILSTAGLYWTGA